MVKRAKRTCPNCGAVQSEQWEDNGKGYYTERGQTYCCQGCAENTGCTCIKAGGGG